MFYSCNGGIAPCNTRSWNFFALQFHENVSPCNIGLRIIRSGYTDDNDDDDDGDGEDNVGG